ncbi:Phage integrase [Roseobacter sp. AzwK-3b]|uniref:tyrosine-type recombinase/integrase n=1 Tax=Roseobacter sp. AzwK-3b TaxID=351016 RepID=UPI000156A62A|nr:site-specific integrase [Roseobacter sp. AzwK-3b]EDM69573.1 Phage integrase [Roseobacter sp. AzwK-3b]
MKARLTDHVIKQHQKQLTNGRATLTDTAVKGFFVEIRRRSATFNLRSSIDGKMRVIKLGCFPELSAEDARQLCLKHKREISVGASADELAKSTKSITLDQFYEDHYLPWYKTYRRASANIVQMYRSNFHLRFGHRQLHSISQTDLKQLTNEMKQLGYAPGSVNTTVVVLRGMLRRADDWGLCRIHHSLHKPPNLLPDTKRHERFLSRDEAQKLQVVLRKRGATPVNLAILFLLYTGARKSEVLNAEWRSINMDRCEWRIPLSKNGQPRTVILSQKAVAILQSARSYQQRHYGKQAKQVSAVFANPQTLLPYHNIWETWKRVRIEADLPDLRLHDLRHSYASTLINAGVSIYEVQKLLGHSHIATTQRYAHLASERLHETVKLLDEQYGRE